MSHTTGRNCNCIATSPTAKLQVETARHTNSRPRCTRVAAPFNPARRFIHCASGTARRNARNYVEKQQRERGKAKDPETIEISAVFRKPVRLAEDAAFRGFPIKRPPLAHIVVVVVVVVIVVVAVVA
jgi:hypothetical protein